MVTCPECNGGVAVAGTEKVNEVVECVGCHSELEVISTSPYKLVVAPDIEEDWGE